MNSAIYKKVHVVGTSTRSFSEAAANAVAKMAKLEQGLSWCEVVEQRASINGGEIEHYQTTLAIGIRVD